MIDLREPIPPGTIVEHVCRGDLWIILFEEAGSRGNRINAFNLQSHRQQLLSRSYIVNFTRSL